ncbi:hypothetical protein [Halomonas denitrificans]|nr:hypothetical protein [Halomonas denitrificans]
MNIQKNVLAAAISATVAATWCLPVAADNHESGDDYMIAMTEIGVTMGHGMEFRDGMKAYMECYEEKGGDNAWSAWWPIDGKLNTVTIVSRMDMWSEMGEQDAASEECWSVVREQVWPHMDSVERRFARKMSDWSGDAEGYTVVKLHQFRVGDGAAFREVVGEVVGHMKDADYEHMGTWYDMDGNHRWEADYFVVEHFDDFAAMDEDRKGANGILVDAVGEEEAAATWDRFDESLADMEPYWTTTLRRDDELSFSPSDD